MQQTALFKAAAFVGRAHSLHLWGCDAEAQQWMNEAKKIFDAANDEFPKEEKWDWDIFFNRTLNDCYQFSDDEFIKEIESQYLRPA